MKKGILVGALMISLMGGCTVKYTTVTLNQEGEGEKHVSLEDFRITTETDQKADGQVDSAVEASPL